MGKGKGKRDPIGDFVEWQEHQYQDGYCHRYGEWAHRVERGRGDGHPARGAAQAEGRRTRDDFDDRTGEGQEYGRLVKNTSQ